MKHFLSLVGPEGVEAISLSKIGDTFMSKEGLMTITEKDYHALGTFLAIYMYERETNCGIIY